MAKPHVNFKGIRKSLAEVVGLVDQAEKRDRKDLVPQMQSDLESLATNYRGMLETTKTSRTKTSHSYKPEIHSQTSKPYANIVDQYNVALCRGDVDKWLQSNCTACTAIIPNHSIGAAAPDNTPPIFNQDQSGRFYQFDTGKDILTLPSPNVPRESYHCTKLVFQTIGRDSDKPLSKSKVVKLIEPAIVELTDDGKYKLKQRGKIELKFD